MYLESQLLFIYVETPLHTGAGAGVEAIDLPIQRERTTGYPMAQAPGIKGALRSEVLGNKKGEVAVVFGPDTAGANDNSLHAGAFSPGDGRILLFPVRSLIGVFAWTTSLDVLQRWQREAVAAGFTNLPPLPDSEPETKNEATSCYAAGNGTMVDGSVVLEEFAYQVNKEVDVKKLAQWLAKYALPDDPAYKWWKEQLPEKLVILPNDDFRDFTQYATEVLTRIRLDPDTKTVQNGFLWTEEHLPPDTLLFAPVRATRFRVTAKELKKLAVPQKWKELLEKQEAQLQARAILEWVSDKKNIPHRLQLGGDETVGRGIISLRWLKASEVKNNGNQTNN
jgi:CRISPR-associated protein Cmr4